WSSRAAHSLEFATPPPLLSLRPRCFYFFIEPTPTDLSTLSLHDALPICPAQRLALGKPVHPGLHRQFLAGAHLVPGERPRGTGEDRKSTRLNSSHVAISYAVFCLKKKKLF